MRTSLGLSLGRNNATDATVWSAGSGVAHLFVWDPTTGTLGSLEVDIDHPGLHHVQSPLSTPLTPDAVLLLGFAARAGGTASSSVSVIR